MNATAYIPQIAPPPGFSAVIFATSYRHPFEEKWDVEQELAARGIVGPVLLDLLLTNATPTRRYFSIPFTGREFGSGSSLVETSNELEVYSKRAFKRCPQPLDKTLLLTSKIRSLL